MNLRGGLALISKALFSYTSSKGFFWTLSLGWMMGPLVYLFVWLVAAGDGLVGGFARGDFILYYLVLILVNQLTYPCSHWTIGESIQSGALSQWLLRPLPLIYETIASDAALKIVCLPFVLGITTLLALFFNPSIWPSPDKWPLFLVLLAGAQILRFMFAYVLSLMAMWTQRISALLAVNDTLLFLLAGQVVPVPLLPGPLGQLAMVLPFRYMLGFPIEYLLGTLTPAQVITGALIGSGWIAVILLAHWAVFARGMKKYTAVGG